MVDTKSISTTTLHFKIDENEEIEKREGTITITSGSLIERIKIYQEGAKVSIVISQDEYVVKAEGDIIQVEVKNNIDVTAVIPSGTDWLREVTTKAMSTNTFYFSADANESYDSRSVIITFIDNINGEHGEHVKITQMPKGAIVISKNEYEFERKGGELTVDISHNIDFNVETSDSWITEISTKSLSKSTISFSIAQNDSGAEREGWIMFTSDDDSITQKIIIRQNMNAPIVTSNKDMIFKPEKATATVEINPDIKWDFDTVFPDNTAYDRLGWLSCISIQEPRIRLTIDKNDTYDSRHALIVVKDIETNVSDTVKITVWPKEYLEAECNSYDISYEGGIIALPFTSSYDYSLELPSDAQWISVVQTKSLQAHELTLSIPKNTTTSSREAKIVIRLNDGSTLYKEILIKQYSDTYVGDVTISNEMIDFLRENKFKRIKGNFTCEKNSMSNLDNMIEEISGSVKVSGITNFDGLYGLKKIGGYLRIGNSDTLLSLEGLNNLESIGGYFDCDRVSFADSNFMAMKSLKSIGAGLYITLLESDKKNNLSSLKGLENLSSIGGGIQTKYLSSLEGLSAINEVASFIKYRGIE